MSTHPPGGRGGRSGDVRDETAADIEGLAKLGAMICITSENGQFYVAIVYEAIGSAQADTIDAAFAEAKRMFRHDLEARYHARKARAA